MLAKSENLISLIIRILRRLKIINKLKLIEDEALFV